MMITIKGHTNSLNDKATGTSGQHNKRRLSVALLRQNQGEH